MLRTRRNGLKKMGLLALALVIALGSLGVAYAAWTDSVYVQGSVNTGTVNINAIASSSTFVYKVPGGEDLGYGPETVVNYVSGTTDQEEPANGMLIASAVATFNNGPTDPDTATMDFTGLFPGIDFQADLQMMYFGTVPVKVSLATVLDPDKAQDAIIEELWQLGTEGDAGKGWAPHTYGIWMEGAYTSDDGATTTFFYDPVGVQLEQYEHIDITLHALLPEDPAYQNLDLSFSGVITVIQWNEYEEPE